MAFALEAQNYNSWLEASQGYLCHPAPGLRQQPDLDRRPEEQGVRRGLEPHARRRGLAPVSEKVAAVLADFVVVDMFASYCTGREDLKGAINGGEAGPADLPVGLTARSVSPL